MSESLLRRGLWGTVPMPSLCQRIWHPPLRFVSRSSAIHQLQSTKAEPADLLGKNPHWLGDSGQDVSTWAKLSCRYASQESC